MGSLVKIAIRNIFKNRKRSLLIGLSIFISCLILLVSNALGNGTEALYLNDYYYFQAGDVVVIWEEAKEIKNTQAEKLFLSYFDVEKDRQNKEALKRFDDFCKQNATSIKYCFKVIYSNSTLNIGDITKRAAIFGITKGELEFLKNTKIIIFEEGDFTTKDEYAVCISRYIADSCNIKLNDCIELDCKTPYGARNVLDYRITGIYKTMAPWQNNIVFMAAEEARYFLDYDPQYFNIARFYLQNPDNSADFARRLDQHLIKESRVLRAESATEASVFFTSGATLMKNIYNYFILFLLGVVALGIRATVRMNLFERMREFGTLRAIGFNRVQNFFIIFFEIFFLALISLILAFIVSLIIIFILAQIGIYVGSGPTSYMFGGEYLYPIFKIQDALFALLVIAVISLIAPLKPTLNLCYQNITDILLKKQKRIIVSFAVLRNLFNGRKKPRKEPIN